MVRPAFGLSRTRRRPLRPGYGPAGAAAFTDDVGAQFGSEAFFNCWARWWLGCGTSREAPVADLLVAFGTLRASTVFAAEPATFRALALRWPVQAPVAPQAVVALVAAELPPATSAANAIAAAAEA